MTESNPNYASQFPRGTDPLDIEFGMIQQGGYMNRIDGVYGLGMFGHYRNVFSLLWPEDDHHRWSDLILKNWLENRIVVPMGGRDSGKTRSISKCALVDYLTDADYTLILMTSTTLLGLELRVWGDIKSLHQRALDRYSWLPGNVVDSKHGIFTDTVEESGDIRDMRRGILCICVLGTHGEFNGEILRSFAGIKQRRRRWVSDEAQFLPREALKILDSLDKGDFRSAFIGNPIAENGKALDEVSEPIGGWDSIGEIKKTTVWKNKYHGVTINLVGIDSPNFDKETPNRFSYMVDQGDVDRVSARPGGRDSLEWWSQIMGVRKAGAISNRVLTVSEIEGYGGFKDVVWTGAGEMTKIYAIDAGFGGDPCVRTWLQFGEEVGGKTVISVADQQVIPILLSASDSPEKQIAKHARKDCQALGIPFGNVFFDAGMYATLAVEMARELSTEVNAINFGGAATERPVSNDMFTIDEDGHTRRLKTWSEHVSKYVTELWFAVRLVAQCRQVRNFPRAAAEEFGRRIWTYVSRDRYELETKDDYKLRNGGESPNHADSLVIAVEGARKRGFHIEFEAPPRDAKQEPDNWLQNEFDKHRKFMRQREAIYA